MGSEMCIRDSLLTYLPSAQLEGVDRGVERGVQGGAVERVVASAAARHAAAMHLRDPADDAEQRGGDGTDEQLVESLWRDSIATSGHRE